MLRAEVDRVITNAVYEPRVFFVRPLGFVVPTEVRRIDYYEVLRFEAVHEEVYREYGFELIDVPPAPPSERAEQIVASVG